MRFNQIPEPVSAIRTRLSRINRELTGMGVYFPAVPLDLMFDICKRNGFTAVQEDGTPWTGVICGREARYSIELSDDHGSVTRYLHVTHCKMEVTGNYEIVAYAN